MSAIVVPLDGSKTSERALPLAAAVAKALKASIVLVEAPVTMESVDGGLMLYRAVRRAEAYLEEQCARLRRDGFDVRSVSTVADPADLIMAEAQRPGVDGVVISTHGRTGLRRALLGSVAERVVRHSSVPVYLMPPRAAATATRELGRVLVPLDGSAYSSMVLGAVIPLAKACRATVCLMRSFGEDETLLPDSDEDVQLPVPAAYDELAAAASAYFLPIRARLQMQGLGSEAYWASGDPAAEIVQMADLKHIDLIALATHGRTGLARLRFGSVAESVLRKSTVPVMTFGHAALKRLSSAVSAFEGRRKVAVEVDADLIYHR